jgi:hypothetical protein
MPNARYIFELIKNVAPVVKTNATYACDLIRIGLLLGFELVVETPRIPELLKVLA